MILKVFTAVVTCYNSDETINFEATRRLIRRHVAVGNNIFCCGTNGDFAALSFKEKTALTAIAVEEAFGKVLVYANAGCPSTYETLRLGKEFARIGVDRIAAVTPYFIHCNQNDLYQHYFRLAEELTRPVLLYDIPACTRNPVDPETVEKLAYHENFCGVKDTSGNMEKLSYYCELRKKNPRFEVYSGADHQILEGFMLGSSGCVSGLANLVPEWISGLASQYNEAKHDICKETQIQIAGLRSALYKLGFAPAVVKIALFIKNQEVGLNRSPSLAPTAEMIETVKSVLTTAGLFV